jgi:hypothetical protein
MPSLAPISGAPLSGLLPSGPSLISAPWWESWDAFRKRVPRIDARWEDGIEAKFVPPPPLPFRADIFFPPPEKKWTKALATWDEGIEHPYIIITYPGVSWEPQFHYKPRQKLEATLERGNSGNEAQFSGFYPLISVDTFAPRYNFRHFSTDISQGTDATLKRFVAHWEARWESFGRKKYQLEELNTVKNSVNNYIPAVVHWSSPTLGEWRQPPRRADTSQIVLGRYIAPPSWWENTQTDLRFLRHVFRDEQFIPPYVLQPWVWEQAADVLPKRPRFHWAYEALPQHFVYAVYPWGQDSFGVQPRRRDDGAHADDWIRALPPSIISTFDGYDQITSDLVKRKLRTDWWVDGNKLAVVSAGVPWGQEALLQVGRKTTRSMDLPDTFWQSFVLTPFSDGWAIAAPDIRKRGLQAFPAPPWALPQTYPLAPLDWATPQYWRAPRGRQLVTQTELLPGLSVLLSGWESEPLLFNRTMRRLVLVESDGLEAPSARFYTFGWPLQDPQLQARRAGKVEPFRDDGTTQSFVPPFYYSPDTEPPLLPPRRGKDFAGSWWLDAAIVSFIISSGIIAVGGEVAVVGEDELLVFPPEAL